MKQKFLLFLVSVFIFLPSYSVSKLISLNNGWTITEGGKSLIADIPTTAMGALLKNGYYSDILSGLNYQKINKKDFDTPWIFSRDFVLPNFKTGQRVFLQLSGIDYRADVKVNGYMVASHDTLAGPFRHFLLDITQYVKADNHIDIAVFRAQNGEPNHGYVDWNVRPADESMGIVRNVSLILADRLLIDHTAVFSKVDTKTLSKAFLTVTTTLRNVSEKILNGYLIGEFESGNFRIPVSIQPYQTRTIVLKPSDLSVLNVNHPRLWWCVGLGNQELYHLRLTFVSDRDSIASDKCTFGIRQVEGYLTNDNHRAFRLNGRKVLIRGGGWTDDIFMRDTPESYRKQFEMIRDMGLNTVRMEGFWGTYDDAFSICDSLGLMVMVGWSCQWEWNTYLQPGGLNTPMGLPDTPEMEHLLTLSLRDQIYGLRQHPSIICWFIGSDQRPYSSWEASYRKVLEGVDDRILQISASSKISDISGPSGVKMTGPYEYVGPTYYFNDRKSGGAFGFNTETSIGAVFPIQEDVDRIVGPSNDWPIRDNKYYNYHCTASSTAMNNLNVIDTVIQKRFGQIDNLRNYLQCANLLSYESTRAMYEAFRTAEPLTTGVIQWKLNSAWPSFYWQLYDYYGVPTAAYYGTKRANQIYQLVYDYGHRKVYAVNASQKEIACKAEMEFYDFHAHCVKKLSKKIKISPNCPEKVFDLKNIEKDGELFLNLTGKKGLISHGEYWVTADSDIYDWKRGNWYITPISHFASYQSLLSLLPGELKVTVSKHKGKINLSVNNLSKKLAFFVEIILLDATGVPISYAQWSDNYITLRPKETRDLICNYPLSATPYSIVVRPWNGTMKKIIISKREKDI